MPDYIVSADVDAFLKGGATLPNTSVNSSLTSVGNLIRPSFKVTAITACTAAANTAECTTETAHGFTAGQPITFCGFDAGTNYGLNSAPGGTTVSGTALTATTFRIAEVVTTVAQSGAGIGDVYVALVQATPALTVYSSGDIYKSTFGNIRFKVNPLVGDLATGIVLESTDTTLTLYTAWMMGTQGFIDVGASIGFRVLDDPRLGVGTNYFRVTKASTGSFIIGFVSQTGTTDGTFKIKTQGTSIPATLCIEGTNSGGTPAGNFWASVAADGVARMGSSGGIIFTNSSNVNGGAVILNLSNSYVIANRHMIVDGNASSGQSGISAAVGGVTADFFADAGSTGVTETDLFSKTTSATTLNYNGDGLRADYAGIFVGSAANSRRIRAYFGSSGTPFFDSAAITSTAAVNWTLQVLLVRVSSTVVRCAATFVAVGTTTTSVTAYTEITSGFTAAATNVLKITGTGGGASANNDIVAKVGSITWKPRYL